MTASRYWTSPDGRRTIDLDAVVLSDDERPAGGPDGRLVWIWLDGRTNMIHTHADADSFLAALKTWREHMSERMDTIDAERERGTQLMQMISDRTAQLIERESPNIIRPLEALGEQQP